MGAFNQPPLLPSTQPALLMRVPAYCTLQPGVCITFHNWNKSQIPGVSAYLNASAALCSLAVPPLIPSHISFLPPCLSAGCCSRFILVVGLCGPRQAPQLFRWVCNYHFIKNDSFGGWSTISSGSRGEDACQIYSVSGNYLSSCLQFTILYLVAWQRLGAFCWSNNRSGIFTL